MSDKPVVIVVHETVAKSWAVDTSKFALFTALIGIGWLLDSNAMQWVGAFIGFVVIISRAADKKLNRRFTIPEARAELDRIEGGKC